MKHIYFPAEWYPQSAIQLTWPHNNSDWDYMIEEITQCYVKIAKEILSRQTLVVVCRSGALIKYLLGNHPNLRCVEVQSNDTWARDHSAISVFEDDKPTLYDFKFNGWGLKFAANHDNQINRKLFGKKTFSPEVTYVNKKNFILEGGALESDGKGTLLTTSACFTAPNRNDHFTQEEIEEHLKSTFGLTRVLWLDHGYLSGDDTDSHIDTMARFCDEHTIAYVKCDDEQDQHYKALKEMESQLKTFVDFEGNPYNLIPLPMADKVIEEGERLPATYANFLIMNEIVLVPFYDNVQDKIAVSQLKKAFPTREIVGVDCLPVIKQHGSLHCITMQYPEQFIV